MRRGSSAHWMTFLSRTSHTGSYAARSIGPSDLSMLRTRSKKPVDPSQTANGGAACAYAHKNVDPAQLPSSSVRCLGGKIFRRSPSSHLVSGRAFRRAYSS